jgi:hemolysin III
MSTFSHHEDTDGDIPRHPIICLTDLLGAYSAVLFVAYTREWSLAILPAVILFQYVASGIYHWMPYNRVRQTIDHVAIAILIAGTYIQFWLILLPAHESMPQIYLLCGIAGMVCVYRIVFPRHTALHGVLYLVLGLAGLILSAMHPHLFTTLGWISFLFGVLLYFVQFVVFASQKPDLAPKFFGYGEVQHTLLVFASDTHLFVAVVYLTF